MRSEAACVGRKAHLNDVSSLRLPPPSSSSDASLLGIRELAREFCFEAVRELDGEACLDFCFFDTVLPLSNAFLRRPSCILNRICLEVVWYKWCMRQMMGGPVRPQSATSPFGKGSAVDEIWW